MSIFVALHHVTHYKYDRPIDLGPQTVRLRPAPHTRTPILSYSLKVTPANHFVNWQQDPQGNWLARFVFPEKATELKIEVDFTAQMTVVNPFDFFVEAYASSVSVQLHQRSQDRAGALSRHRRAGPLFDAFWKGIPREADSTVDFLVELNAQLQKKISYVIRMEPGIQTPEETLALGSGSCRDSAWLLDPDFRHLGLAARFVSGYLIQLRRRSIRSTGRARSTAISPTCTPGPRSICRAPAGSGSTSTSGMLAGEGHIPLAATPHYRSAAPISGRVEPPSRFRLRDERHAHRRGAAHHAAVLRRILGALDALGEQVDADLTRQDVRLTMGGEPTFVSVDDYRGAGMEHRRASARPSGAAGRADPQAARPLRAGRLLHYGQGKWYPGESCRAGPSRSTGARTACRSGRMPR